jgi:Flp pilus assembly protein TadG
VTVEAVLLTPVLVVFLLMALGFGRYEQVRQEVVSAARAGAQAAAVMPTATEAASAASAAAVPSVFGQQRSCVHVGVVTDTSDFTPGGDVRVRVSCKVDLSDLLVPGMPASATVTAEVAAPIDPYRELG